MVKFAQTLGAITKAVETAAAKCEQVSPLEPDKRLPLLVAPRERQGILAKALAGSYDLGWLFVGPDGARWMTWGNSKNRTTTELAVQDCLRKQGEREVLWWHEPLPNELTADQVAMIRAGKPA